MGDGGAGKREAERNRQILSEQRNQFERAQEILAKGRDEGISDLEAANARAQGLITDQQEAIIATLNRGGQDAIQTLNQLQSDLDSRLENAQSNILDTIVTTAALNSDEIRREIGAGIEDVQKVEKELLDSLVQTGALQREALTDNTLEGIADLTSSRDAALAALQPYKEAGERAILQQNVLSGRATPEEVERFREQFGDIESSPLVQERIQEEEKAIARQQQALGRRFSGLGQQEILERGARQIRGEEIQRQLQNAQQASQLGLGAASQSAGIQQGTGQNLLSARSNLGQLIANSLGQEQQLQGQIGAQSLGLTSQLRSQLVNLLQQNRARQQELQAGIQQGFATQGANAAQQTGTNVASIQSGLGTQQSNILNQLLNQRVNLASQLGANKANIRTGSSANIAGSLQTGAQSGTQGLLQASEKQAESESAFLRDVAGLGSKLIEIGTGGILG